MFKIEDRNEIRQVLDRKATKHKPGNILLCLISQSLDDYIEHRIQTDKVLEGILKDIQGNLAELVDFRAGLEADKRLN